MRDPSKTAGYIKADDQRPDPPDWGHCTTVFELGAIPVIGLDKGWGLEKETWLMDGMQAWILMYYHACFFL